MAAAEAGACAVLQGAGTAGNTLSFAGVNEKSNLLGEINEI
jgi:hypothetical protein